MKGPLEIRFIFLALLCVFFGSTLFQTVYAQKTKKDRVRLKAEYVKIIDDASYLEIKASSRVNKQNVDVSNIELNISTETEVDEVNLGTVSTDMHGKTRFVIKNLNDIESDSANTYNFNISFKGNDIYKKASKSISIKDARIKAGIITKDSINYISATLSDTVKDSLLTNQIVDVYVQRLFRPLKIGKEFNSTDNTGTVIVPIEDGIPGVNGNLTLEIVLKDHDDYGTVKALVNAPLGIPIVDESTFDKRTMWSPRNKTPLFILMFTSLLIFSVWGLIVYLIIKLFKINKS
ncbi:MAG: hypothetical protein KJN66_00540 [Bacteroidia bacterium]|nr:hypothetical protein [Bacteroidia bacterium]